MEKVKKQWIVDKCSEIQEFEIKHDSHNVFMFIIDDKKIHKIWENYINNLFNQKN